MIRGLESASKTGLHSDYQAATMYSCVRGSPRLHGSTVLELLEEYPMRRIASPNRFSGLFAFVALSLFLVACAPKPFDQAGAEREFEKKLLSLEPGRFRSKRQSPKSRTRLAAPMTAVTERRSVMALRMGAITCGIREMTEFFRANGRWNANS